MIKHKSSITIFRNNSPSFPKCVMAYSLLHFFYLNTKNATDGKKRKNDTMFTFEILYLFCIPF